MSRIFVSHASADNADACALGEWLNEAGFEQQFFLDFDLRRGIAAGEVWPQAIMRALERCEVVLCLLSPAWARSDWCRIEFEKGKDFGKSLLFAVIDANGYDGLLTHIRSTYQVVHLHGGGAQRTILSRLPKTLREIEVSFDADALERLRIGLKKAGLSPDGFPLTDRDRLYPGLRALDTQDAAVFFARDAEIVRTMGMLRSMRRQARARVLVVFAASGAGKSSLLRAGLWPRLRRAEREFLVLPVLRPGDAALSGEEGLIACLHACALREGAPPEWSRERCRQWLTSEGLTAPLERLRKMAASRLAAISDDDGDPEPPMPMLMIDQGEELFSEQAGVEGRQLLALMTDALRLDAMMVVICLRPEACERWQNLSGMDGVEQRFYLLPKISQALVKDIIEGPAQRDRDTNGRDGLRIDPLLTERLLQEWSGEDALPLLALTLRRLYDAYGASGRLELAAYESVGGLGGMLDAAIEQAVDRAIEVGAMPRDPACRQAMVQRTFVPALIAIHPQTQAPLRRIARFDLLPPESRGLVRALLDARLLSESVRQIDGVPRRLVEVAHEALLRQWPALRHAVERELAAQARLEGLTRTAAAWWESGRNDAALRDGGQSLREIETLLERPDLRASMDEATSTYLAECHAQEARLMLQAQWRTRWERVISPIRRHAVLVKVMIVATAFMAASAAWAWRSHTKLTTLLALSRQESESGVHAAALRFALSAARHQSFWLGRESHAVNHQLRILASPPIWTMNELSTDYIIESSILLADGAQVAITNAVPHGANSPAGTSTVFKRDFSLTLVDMITHKNLKVFDYGAIEHIQHSDDGSFIAVATNYSKIEIVDTKKNRHVDSTYHPYGTYSDSSGYLSELLISKNGTSMLAIGWNRDLARTNYAYLWALSNSESDGVNVTGLRQLDHDDVVEFAAFSDEGGVLATSSRDGIIKLWYSEDGELIRSLPIKSQVEHFAFSRDGKRFLVQSPNGQVTLWDPHAGALVGNYQGDHELRPSFSPDGRQFAMASSNRALTVHESASGSRLIDIKHQDGIDAFEFSHDGALLATASNDGKILITDLEKKTTMQVASRSESATEIRFSMDDRKLLVRGPSETALLDISKATTLVEMPIGTSFEFKYAGDLVLAKTDFTIYIFNISPLTPDARSAIESADDDALVDTLCRILSPSAGRADGATGVPGFYSAHTDAELSRAEVLDPETDRDPCRPATAWQRLEAAVPDWLR